MRSLTLRQWRAAWGADVIRGQRRHQALPDEILEAGYGIYSTICIIRRITTPGPRRIQDKPQQRFPGLPEPVTAASRRKPWTISLLAGLL